MPTVKKPLTVKPPVANQAPKVVAASAQPQTGKTVLPPSKAPAPPKAQAVMSQSTSHLPGTQYVVQPTQGGVYHVWPNGVKTFVPSKQPAGSTGAPAATAAAATPAYTPSIPPATESAGSQEAAAPQGSGANTSPDPQSTLPVDPEYAAAVARRNFLIGQRRTALGLEETSDVANYEEALRRMAENQVTSQKNTDIRNHRLGLFNSGQNAADQQDVITSYARQRADALGGLTSRQAARQAEIAGLDQGYLSGEGEDYGNAAGRQVGRDTTLAQLGSLASAEPVAPVAPVAPAAPPPVAPVKAPLPKKPATKKPSYTTKTAANGAVYHVYKDGRKVAVRKATRKTT